MSAHKWPEARPDAAKIAALGQLTKAYEEHCEAEQIAVHEERHEAATIEHGYCVIILRAMVAEDIDPPPKSRK